MAAIAGRKSRATACRKISGAVPESRSHSAGFQPGNPEKGLVTFENICESCHAFGTRTTTPKIDLLKRPAPDLLTGYVAAMWNHSRSMEDQASKQGLKLPTLKGQELADIAAYFRSFTKAAPTSQK